MQAIKAELHKWVKGNKLVEVQNGFRPDRRLADNLFVLTQCIEVLMAQKTPLWLAFLDTEGTYDNINRGLLSNILEEESVNKDCVELIRIIYKDNQVEVSLEGKISRQPVQFNRGLKQGCPLSPLLFTLYVAGIERRLEESNLDFDQSHNRGGKIFECSLPGLMYADDAVLLAGNAADLQRLADICAERSNTTGSLFVAQKSQESC